MPLVIIPLPEAATYMEGVETKEIEQSRSQASATQLEYKAKNQQILAFFNEIAPGIGPRQASPSRMMNIPLATQESLSPGGSGSMGNLKK